MPSASVSTEHVSASHTAAHHRCKACSAQLVACPHTRGAEPRRPISESCLCPTRTRDARLEQFLVRTCGTKRRMHQGRNAKRPATGLPKKWCRSRFLMVCKDWKQQYKTISPGSLAGPAGHCWSCLHGRFHQSSALSHWDRAGITRGQNNTFLKRQRTTTNHAFM